MRSKPIRARLTASADSKLLKEIQDFRWNEGSQELLRQTAHKNREIELVARRLYSEGLRNGVRHAFDDLLLCARNAVMYAHDKHPDDLPEIYQIFGNPDAEPRRRRFNSNLEQDVERVAKELQSKWQRPGVRHDLAQIEAFVYERALEVLNTHPDDLHEAFRSLGNPKVPPTDPYSRYVIAERCDRVEVRFAPDGTSFMPVRTLVVADPEQGWGCVRVLAVACAWPTAAGGATEMLTPMTASTVKELLASAAAMKLQVSRKHYLLSPKQRVST